MRWTSARTLHGVIAFAAVALLLSPVWTTASPAQNSNDGWEGELARELREARVRRVISLGFGLDDFSYYDPDLAGLAYGIESDSLDSALAGSPGLTAMARSDSVVGRAVEAVRGDRIPLIRLEDLASVGRLAGAEAIVVGKVVSDSLALVMALHVNPAYPIHTQWLAGIGGFRVLRGMPPQGAPVECRIDELRETVPWLLRAREWRRAREQSRLLAELAPQDELAEYWNAMARRREPPDRSIELRLAIPHYIDERPDMAARLISEFEMLSGRRTPEIGRWIARTSMSRDLLVERLIRSVEQAMAEQRWVEGSRDASLLLVLRPDGDEVPRWRQQIAARLEARLRSLRFAAEMTRRAPVLGAEPRPAPEIRAGRKGEDLTLEQLALPVARAVPPAERDPETIDVEAGRTRLMIWGCYALALKENPSLAGVVAIEFAVEPSGVVRDAHVSASSLRSRSVEQCVVDVVRTWTFSATTTTETFTYTFRFQPN